MRRAVDRQILDLHGRIREVRENGEITIPALVRKLEREVVRPVDTWMRERRFVSQLLPSDP